MRTRKSVKKIIANDRGISLVELIVVISIMVVMTGLISISVSLMFSKDAESVAKTIDDALSETRMLSMSKDGTISMILNINSDSSANNIEIKQTTSTGEAVTTNVLKTIDFKKDATLLVEGDGGLSESSGAVIFEFDKGNGSVKNPVPSGIITITATAKRLSTKTSKVQLITATGRHYLE